jgi:topoisomerase IV subunit A
MDVVSTAYQPKINIVYNKLLKATKNLPDKEVNLADFIEPKGMKAIGNQLTKLKTKEIQLIGPIEGEESWPEPEKPIELEVGEAPVGDDETPFEIEWDLGKESDEDDDEKEQMKLF